jgi:hypothetical protein
MISNQISVKPSRIARVLGLVAFLLVLASTGGQLTAYLTGHPSIFGLVGLFNLDAEENIPTFFSTFLLLFAALLLAVITVLKRNQMTSHVSHWAILSFGFLLMAADEMVSFHEKLGKPTSKLLGDAGLGLFSWAIPGIALVVVLAPFFVRFLLHLPAKTRLTFLMAAILYLGGSIGFELIGGAYAKLHGLQNFTYSMIATVEESLEMAGLIIFIWALLVYFADNYKEVRFRFDGDHVNSGGKHGRIGDSHLG